MPSAARILLVDDDPIVLEIIGRVLERGGHEVLRVDDGREALRMLQNEPFDLMMSDVQMPRVDGLTLLRAARDRNEDVPVVLLAGAPLDDDAERTLRYLPTDFLLKPVEPAQLLKCVLLALRRSRLAQLRRALLIDAGDRQPAPERDSALASRTEPAASAVRVVYQPIVSWSKRAIFGYEAQPRGQDARSAQAAGILAASLAPLSAADASRSLFVSVHACELQDQALAAPPTARVYLQISERTPFDAVEHLAQRIAELRRLGFGIVMDHVGAACSGLSRFIAIKPDVLKLDITLVRRLDADHEKRAQLRELLELCAHLDVEVVAAGIDSVFERDQLFDLGCDLFQGHLFARPATLFPEARF